MTKTVAVLTMVKDDYFFLEKWVSYYGGMFGRDALYVFSHGGDPEVARIAEGCNVIAIPDHFDEAFDAKRWRLLNNMTNGLRNYYDFVICVDVDEFVVLDPKTGKSLPEFLARRRNVIITPIGVEVVHVRDQETTPIDENGILASRRHCRYSSYFSKPCIIGKPVDLARGGHYAKEPELKVFRNLYLFHMKYADYDLFRETLRRRVASVARLGVDDPKKSQISTHWFAESEGFGNEIERLAMLPREKAFDFSDKIEAMKQTWAPRNSDGLWHFRKDVGKRLYPIPRRFAGII